MGGVKIIITGAVSILIQFGLAIAGWGAFFAYPALRALAVPSGSSGLSSGKQEDRGNRWVLVAFGVIALSMAYFWFIRLKRTSSHEAP